MTGKGRPALPTRGSDTVNVTPKMCTLFSQTRRDNSPDSLSFHPKIKQYLQEQRRKGLISHLDKGLPVNQVPACAPQSRQGMVLGVEGSALVWGFFKLKEKCHSEIFLRSFFVLSFPLSLSTVKFCWYLTKAVISVEKKILLLLVSGLKLRCSPSRLQRSVISIWCNSKQRL